MTNINYVDAAAALKVIAHPVRLKIIEALKSKELSVSDIQRKLHMKQSITSQHLTGMRNKNILRSRREGNSVYYSISNKNVLKIIHCIQSCQR